MRKMVSRRWKVLASVGLLVALADQGTKFLAIKHLTPGLLQAHFEGRPLPETHAGRRAELEQLGLGTELEYFYRGVVHPCEATIGFCRTIPVIKGFWAWRYVENPGAAWGFLANADDRVRVPFFLLVSIGAMVLILTFFKRLEEDQMALTYGLSLVFGGAIGNFIDRLHLSYVIDFIDWYVGSHHWPTFNIADAAITVGVGFLIVDWIQESAKARAAAPSHEPAAPAAETE